MSEPFDPYYTWLGIRPEEQPANHYHLLGLRDFEDNPEVIQHVADRQMTHLRSFQAGQHADLSQKLLNEVATAKLCLLSPEKRATYDAQLRQESAAASLEETLPKLPLSAAAAEASGGKSAGASTPIPRSPTPWVAIAIASGVAIVAIVAFTVWLLFKGESPAETGSGATELVFLCPGNRDGINIQVDGKAVVLPVNGPWGQACSPGQHSIKATRPGSYDFEEDVDVRKGQSRAVFLAFSAQPVEPPTKLAFYCPADQRAGVKIAVDGKAIAPPSNWPCSEVCKPGSHRVRATRPGFFDFEQPIEVAAGKVADVHLRWKKIPPTGLAFPLPPPPQRVGMKIEVDGKAILVPPKGPCIELCMPGAHRIRAMQVGYNDIEQTVEVRDRELTNVKLLWKRIVPTTLMIVSGGSHVGLRVELDGKEILMPIVGPWTAVCSPGAHRIRAFRPGFDECEQVVDVPKNQGTKVDLMWHWVGSPPLDPAKVAKSVSSWMPNPAPLNQNVALAKGSPIASQALMKLAADDVRRKVVAGLEVIGDINQDPFRSVPGRPSSAAKEASRDPFRSVASQSPGPRAGGASGKPPVKGAEATASSAAQPAVPKSLPVPSPQIQRDLLIEVLQQIPVDNTNTKLDEQHLCKWLFDTAFKPAVHPDKRFVCLRRAAELACNLGDTAMMFRAVDAIGAEFDIDALDVENKLVARMRSDQGGSALIDIGNADTGVAAARKLAERAVANNRFDVAGSTLQEAAMTCLKRQYAGPLKEIRRQMADVQRLARGWEQVSVALNTLNTSADDPQANLAVGRWYCFQNGNLERGWPYLAKSSEGTLKKVAQQELSPPKEAEAQARLADSWLGLYQTHSGTEREIMGGRANYWYQQAEAALPEGASKAKVDRRLKELARGRHPAAKISDVSATPTSPAAEPSCVHLKPGAPLPKDAWVDLLEHAEMRAVNSKAAWRQAAEGFTCAGGSVVLLPVTVTGDYDLQIQFTRNEGDGMVSMLFLVGQQKCGLRLSENAGQDSRLGNVKGAVEKPAKPIVSIVVPGDLNNAQQYTVLLRVRLVKDNASIEVQLDGKPYLYWAGPQAVVKPAFSAALMPSQSILALASDAPTSFDKAWVRLVSGNGSLADRQDAEPKK